VRTIAAAAAFVTLLSPWPRAATAPRLAVIIVVDQMRADYVDRFNGEWTGGLKRMVTQGAWFQQAAYPYLTTVTCAGHATIATGSFPHTHGVFQNAWWDRDARKQMTCTEDPRTTDVGYGVTVTGGDSPYRLQVPTFGDQMRMQRQAHVVSLSLKDRSAIMLGGHGGDVVTWLTNTLDGWATSSVYSETGVPAVKAFIDANPLTADFGKTWDRILPASAYSGPDDGVGEAPPKGWTASFPHPLNGTADKADATYLVQWERSPFADAYLGRFAAALVQSLKLGQHEGTDVLAVSFSAPDIIGHDFGPRSHEVQDTYARLDQTIGALFNQLDAIVGTDRWVVGLSADHGVTPIPEQLVAEGKDAGRISGGAIVDAIEQVLKPALGEGRHVAGGATARMAADGRPVSSTRNMNDIYFEPGVYDTIRKSKPLTDAVVAAIASRPGIQRVFRSDEVRGAGASKDPLLRAAALSYVPGRGGDLIFTTKPGWIISASGTNHGSATADDQRVPVMFFGHGVKPGKYQQAASPADLAPTLAALCGFSMKAEGHRLPCVQ
jgi:predicted AlkP superfamily pyrophosphatase or phosphodiesterase